MFDFQDLFQWDRFITPSRTDTAERPDLAGPVEGGSLMGSH
jgi:hypothetical protein